MSSARLPVAAGFAAAAVSGLGFATAAFNACTVPRLPRPTTTERRFDEPVTVVVPARNESRTLPALVGDLKAQTGVPALRVVVYDDNSSDGTAEAAERVCGRDDRFVVIRGDTEPPAGWVGKPAACVAAVERTGPPSPAAGIVVFLDADVRLHPNALATACLEARRLGCAMLSPWPFQVAPSWPERLVQPLLAWSWSSTLPVATANRDFRSSTVVACGQFLVFDAATYFAVGGHRTVASSVTEDLDIARVLRRSGHRTAVAIAGRYATCRMYKDGRSLRAGYGRWLWSSFGGAATATTLSATLWCAYVLPPVVAIAARGAVRRWAMGAYAAALGSRVITRWVERGSAPTKGDLVDAAAHPVAVAAATWLLAASHRDHARGLTRWKGRPLS
ncbi:glycosyltransferase [Rhodococcus sp. NPDC058521]|uniref:glycosyltransferase n=1 Tax=Rhodococcus sp. NPDC058521 TaxID=3346536 RepID=UPI003646BC06